MTTVGIDLAKSIVQVHAVDAAGQVVWSQGADPTRCGQRQDRRLVPIAA